MWCNTISQPKFGVPFSVAQTSKTARQQGSKPRQQDTPCRLPTVYLCQPHNEPHSATSGHGALSVRYLTRVDL